MSEFDSRSGGMTRRSFLGAAGLAAGASLLGNEAKAQSERELNDRDYQKWIREGWDMEVSIDLVLSPEDQIKSMRELYQAMAIYPPGWGKMLREAFVGNYSEEEINELTNNQGLSICPQIWIGELNNGFAGYADKSIQTIVLDPTDTGHTLKDLLEHEMAHLVHASIWEREISAEMGEYVGDEWRETQVEEGFVTSYAMNNSKEDFAETATFLFEKPLAAIDLIKNDPGSALALKLYSVMEAYKFVSRGIIDWRYWEDLAANKVNLEYWETKLPAEDWRRSIDQGEVFVTNLEKDRNEMAKPLLVVALNYKDGEIKTIWNGDAVEGNGAIALKINGKEVKMAAYIDESDDNNIVLMMQNEGRLYGISRLREGESKLVYLRSGDREVGLQVLQTDRGVVINKLFDEADGMEGEGFEGLASSLERQEKTGIFEIQANALDSNEDARKVFMRAGVYGIGAGAAAAMVMATVEVAHKITIFGLKEKTKPSKTGRRRFMKGMASVLAAVAGAGAGVANRNEKQKETPHPDIRDVDLNPVKKKINEMYRRGNPLLKLDLGGSRQVYESVVELPKELSTLAPELEE